MGRGGGGREERKRHVLGSLSVCVCEELLSLLVNAGHFVETDFVGSVGCL